MRKIANLRHRIQLQRNLTTGRAETGARVDNWTTVATVWGELLELRGREYHAAQEAHSAVDAKIRIRFRSDVKPEWRAVYGDRVFDIVHAIDLKGRSRELELMVTEIR